MLFVVSGPSGVGKSTLIKAAMGSIPGLEFSISATTRAPRAGEVDGVDYYFLDAAAFREQVAAGAFLEHATVYDRSYGTLALPTRRALEQGRSLVLDVDVQGSAQVKAAMPDSVHVLVVPPDVPALEARLQARGTDSDAVIAKRMAHVAQQLAAVEQYDYVVINDELPTAHRVFEGVLLAELSRVGRHPGLVRRIRGDLAARPA